MIYLIVFNLEQLGVRYSESKLGLLHGRIVDLKSLQLYYQHLRSTLNHHLAGGYLLSVASLAKELIVQVQQLLGAELL